MWKILDKRVLISPSVIAADLSTIGNKAKELNPDIVDLLHIDVMDGHFVPNLTIGPGFVKGLKANTNIPLDVHLMIEKPEDSIQKYIEQKPWCIVIHYEATRFPARVLKLISEAGIRAGIALNPATPVEVIFDIHEYADLALIMSVDPGFYGQSFMSSSLNKIKRLKRFIDDNNLGERLAIQVDGGISKDNIAPVAQSGARIIVAGSSAFGSGDVNRNVEDLKKIAIKAL